MAFGYVGTVFEHSSLVVVGDVSSELMGAVEWLTGPVPPVGAGMPTDLARAAEVRRWFCALLVAARTKDLELISPQSCRRPHCIVHFGWEALMQPIGIVL
jgi:hypothetical protein